VCSASVHVLNGEKHFMAVWVVQYSPVLIDRAPLSIVIVPILLS